MIRTLLMTTAALAIATPALAAPSKSAAPTAAMAATNPFAKPSSLPYQTPDYARIKDSDYLPAFIAGMAQNKREIVADDKLQKVFGKDRCTMFEMNKHLSRHLS